MDMEKLRDLVNVMKHDIDPTRDTTSYEAGWNDALEELGNQIEQEQA